MRHLILISLLAGCAASGNVGQRSSSNGDQAPVLRVAQVELRTATTKTPLGGYWVRVVDGRGVVQTVPTNALGFAIVSLPSSGVDTVLIRGERTSQAWGKPTRVQLYTDAATLRLVVEVPE